MTKLTKATKAPSFNDEIELFRIPKSEQAAALKWELRRDFYRQESPENCQDLEPWLALTETFKAYHVKANTKPHSPPACRIATKREAARAFADADRSPALQLGHVSTDAERELSFMQLHDEGLLLALRIDPAQGHEAIKAAALKILDQLEEMPRKSGKAKASDVAASLRGLAVLRAKRKAAQGANYMRHFQGTPYAGKEADQKTRLREIKKKLPWA
ncbi:hypothetical protein N9R65_02620 [Opitutales bacterium]|nr:hypothetical protein [Opitutales bacterium]